MKKAKSEDVRFNPPFSKSVKSNIGKTFLNLIKRHFQKQINYIKSLTKTLLKWVIVVWVICHLYSLHITWMQLIHKNHKHTVAIAE